MENPNFATYILINITWNKKKWKLNWQVEPWFWKKLPAHEYSLLASLFALIKIIIKIKKKL